MYRSMASRYCSYQETQARRIKFGRSRRLRLDSSISRRMSSPTGFRGGILNRLIFIPVGDLVFFEIAGGRHALELNFRDCDDWCAVRE